MSETLNPWQGDTVEISIDFYTSPLAGRVSERQQALFQRQLLNETHDAYIVTDEIQVFCPRQTWSFCLAERALPQYICQVEKRRD